MGALISMALETNTVDGIRMEKKSINTNNAMTLMRINFRKRILFPLKGFKSYYIYYHNPNTQYPKFLPATSQTCTFKCNIAHGNIKMG